MEDCGGGGGGCIPTGVGGMRRVVCGAEEVGNGVISDHEMWVWSKFIHGIRHSHWMGTVAEELPRIEL